VDGSCGASGGSGASRVSKERVVVAIHRDSKAESVPAGIDVKLGETWMEGCRLGVAEIHSGGSSAAVSGDLLHVQAQGDAVWMGVCE
jgi:hypothetical protein